MNKTEAKFLGALLTAVADERYEFRTLKGVADKAGVSVDGLADTVEANQEFFVTANRRGDNAPLVGLGDSYDKGDMHLVGTALTALSNPDYAYRTARAIAKAAQRNDVTERDVLAALDSEFAEMFVIKHRRSDGAALIGLVE